MDRAQHQDAIDNGTTFYCSMGHPRVFRPSQVERLKAELDDLREKYDDAWNEGWESAEGQWRHFARCPFSLFDSCPQGHYEYAGPLELARHLHKSHGIDGLWQELRVVRAG